jgi:hypothetical protein
MDFDLVLAISVVKQYAECSQAQVLWEQFKRKELPEVHHKNAFQSLDRKLLNSLIKELAKRKFSDM